MKAIGRNCSKEKENGNPRSKSIRRRQKLKEKRTRRAKLNPNYYVNIKKQNRKKAILESMHKTPDRKNRIKEAMKRSIRIQKVKIKRDSSLEKEFGYVNGSESYDPETVFKQFPVIFWRLLI